MKNFTTNHTNQHEHLNLIFYSFVQVCVRSWLIIFLLFFGLIAHAQQIPRQIFVGDRASLVVPLSSSAAAAPIINTTELPKHNYIDFHKISLFPDRLVIEFTAWSVGKHELPIIEAGGEYFTGLTVTVDSVLDSRALPVLAGPAATLAMPGTTLLIYGTMTALTAAICLAIWFAIKGKRFTQKWKEKWTRWVHFTSIKNTQKRLCKSVIKGIDNRLILNYLSIEFRKFLAFLTGKNCMVMTPPEFKKLSPQLSVFFKTVDTLRFSGDKIDSHEVLGLLADLHEYIKAQS